MIVEWGKSALIVFIFGCVTVLIILVCWFWSYKHRRVVKKERKSV